MIELKLSEILKETSGSLKRGSADQIINGISIDSRTVKPGDIFIALDGQNFKGSDFVEEALEKGAIGCIVGNPAPKTSSLKKIIIEVDDSLKALQDIARYILRKVNPQVIAITGSTGKTTVKDILKTVLAKKYKVVASLANYNNEIGLPLTLLRLKQDTQIVIAEFAMRGLGQIAQLCRIAAPDIALITNIGQSHIGLLQSMSNIVKAKGEIIEGLKREGTIFLNSDDKNSKQLAVRGEQLAKKVVFFGQTKKADVCFANISLDDLARPTFDLIVRETFSHYGRTKDIRRKVLNSSDTCHSSMVRIKLPIPGAHNAINACAAAAIALEHGLSLKQIKGGLEEVSLSPGRLEISRNGRFTIINDSYNASPASMKAALDVLQSLKGGRKVAILGDMLELGPTAVAEHQNIGRYIASQNINQLITVGNLSKYIAKAAISAGKPASNVTSFKDCSGLKKEIISYLRASDVILIKASRALKLEEIADYLQKKG